MKRIISIIALVCLCVAAWGQREYRPEDVPNVHLKDARRYVSDPDNIMSPAARAQADASLKALCDSTSAEIAVVLLPSIGEADIFDFTQRLASDWGVGKSDKDNGLVVLFDMGGRKVRMHPGQGLEGILTDVACARIIDEAIIPRMKNGDVDGAVLALAGTLDKVLTDPEAAAEIRSTQQNSMRSPLGDDALWLLLVIPIIATVLSYAMLLSLLAKLRGKDSFQKALILHNDSSAATGLVLTLLSLGLGLPAMLIRRSMLHRYRNQPRKCDVCGTQMEKVDEERDNYFLTPAQDLEERLKTVDYDVWLCPKCGSTEIFPFPERNTDYTKCPHCGTHAMRLLYDRIEKRPTAASKGVGVKVYECMNCHKRVEQRYSIPAQVAAPVIIGGIGGRGGGGGGFSGGSFGGGSFGGGGSTGSW